MLILNGLPGLICTKIVHSAAWTVGAIHKGLSQKRVVQKEKTPTGCRRGKPNYKFTQ